MKIYFFTLAFVSLSYSFPTKKIHSTDAYQTESSMNVGILASNRQKEEDLDIKDRKTNTSCMLQLVNDSFQDLIIRLKDGRRNKLIFFDLQFEDELSDAINDTLVLPTQWIWATETFGRNILMFKEMFWLFIYRYISMGILEENVKVKSVPRLCLRDIHNSSIFEEIVLDLFLLKNSSTLDLYRRDSICKLKNRIVRRKDGSEWKETIYFYHNCFIIPQGQKNFVAFELQASGALTIFSLFLVVLTIILVGIVIYVVNPSVEDSFDGTRDKPLDLTLKKGNVEVSETNDIHLLFIRSFSLIEHVCFCFRKELISCFKKLILFTVFIIWIGVFITYLVLTETIKDREFETRATFESRHEQEDVFVNIHNFAFYGSFFCIVSSFFCVILHLDKTQQDETIIGCKCRCGAIFFIVLFVIFSGVIANIALCIYVSIVNFDTYHGLVVASSSASFYAINCVYQIKMKYKSCFKILQNYIREKFISTLKTYDDNDLNIDINSKTLKVKTLIIYENERKAFKLCLLKICEGTPIVFDTDGDIFISRSLFEEIIMRDERGFPGKLCSCICSEICKIVLLLVSIFFVFFVLIVFEDEYNGANEINITVTVATSILPWIKVFLVCKSDTTNLDIKCGRVEEIILNLLSSRDEKISIAGQSFPNDDDDGNIPLLENNDHARNPSYGAFQNQDNVHVA